MKKIFLKFIELLPFFTVLTVLVYIGYWQMAQFKKIEHLELQILQYQKQLSPIINRHQNNNQEFEQQAIEKNRLGFGQNPNKLAAVITSPLPATKAEAKINIDNEMLEEVPAQQTPAQGEKITKQTKPVQEKESVIDYDTKDPEIYPVDTAELAAKRQDEKTLLEQQLKKCQEHFDARRLTIGGKKEKGNAFDCFTSILEEHPENEQAKAAILRIEKKYEGYIKNNISINKIAKAERFLSVLNRINPQNTSIKSLQKQLMNAKELQQSSVITEIAPDISEKTKSNNSLPTLPEAVAKISPQKKHSSTSSFVEITAGCFNKKSSAGSSNTCIKKNYLISKFEVTQKQWKDIMGENPSHFKSCGASCPVENVSWFEVQEFIRRLNKQTGNRYRLPTDNEWEYAARAGSDAKFSFGNNPEKLASYGNYCDKKCTNDWRDNNHDDGAITTAPVGSYRSNQWGLFDIHGNVWEWVQDKDSDKRVYRGGSWGDNFKLCQSSSKGSTKPDFHVSGIGFRLVQN